MAGKLRKAWRAGALLAALGAGCAGCAAGGDPAVITEAGLTGTWVSDGGARIRFAADRTMSGSGLDKALVGVLADCPVSLSGRWSFHSPVDRQGGRYADDTFTKGETLTLSTGDAPADCAWEAQVRRDQQGWNLCLTPDLDSLCGATELLRRDEGRLP